MTKKSHHHRAPGPMTRVHLQLPPHLLAEIDDAVGEDRECKTRPSFIRAAVREKLRPGAPALDIPSDLAALFAAVVESRGEPYGAVLTEAIRRFVVEETRQGSDRKGRTR